MRGLYNFPGGIKFEREISHFCSLNDLFKGCFSGFVGHPAKCKLVELSEEPTWH